MSARQTRWPRPSDFSSAKVPEPQRTKLYTIPPSAPFLSTLAKAVLNGDLPAPGGPKPDPLNLPLATIYLPTRRAVRALRDAFLDASGGKAALLPRLKALGDPDEDAAIIFGAEGEFEGAPIEGNAGAPAIDPLPRRLALTRLVLAWQHTMRARGHTALDFLPFSTPAQASYLAAELARLMDFIESEEKDLAALPGTVPDEHADHWALTADFLTILTEQWPNYLRDLGLVSPAARRRALMAFEAARLLANPPPGPVIAAGSTGTVPATGRLLKIIASLPQGAVVLPGFDLGLDRQSWKSVREHPEHPQAGMAELLAKLGARPGDVAYVPGSEPGITHRARLELASEVLRPAGETGRWQEYLRDHGKGSQTSLWGLETALEGLSLIEAPTAHDEAEAIALILRSVSETPERTAALVTPDRTLARRVASRLKSFNLDIDDSAGVPVARTVPGAFLDLVLAAVESGFAPAELMALLKHPLARLGHTARETRYAARALERAAFRDVYIGEGLAGVAEALEAARSETKRRRGRKLSDIEHALAMDLVASLEDAFAPLTALFADGMGRLPSEFAAAQAATAEALARDEKGSPAALWQGDAGEALSVLFAELIASGGSLSLSAADYVPFYRSLLAGRAARPRAPAHPRLFIWGPLEARLQQPDVVILGSLNDGVWPKPPEASPWLSRKMAEEIGLPPPERRIGLAAHDFAQGLGASTVYLTRAVKVEGVPTVPSRWLQRLQALIGAAGLETLLTPKEPWLDWARARDRADGFRPALPPRPRPPVAARPRKLSVSRIERMLANPYDVYARNILKLEPLRQIAEEPDLALRGTIIHAVLNSFTLAHPDELPGNIQQELVTLAEEAFAALGGSPRVAAFWRPSFRRFARWFAATEPGRREGVVRVNPEVEGRLHLPLGTGFDLTARADRIDLAEDGSLRIYDYKSGEAPTQAHVDDLYAPQLPLEAAIALGGGFGEIERRRVSALRYIKASGRGDGGEEQDAGKRAPEQLGIAALEALHRLIERFDRPNTAYVARRRAGPAFRRVYDFDDYAHLARVQEWSVISGQGDGA
jgi:ATP-dependent helicase/nuclease subunit B